MGTMSHMRPSRDKQVVVPIHNVGWNSKSRLFTQHLSYDRKHINSHMKGSTTLVSCAKTAEPINTSKSGDASSDSTPQGSLEKKPLQATTFPNGFEALVLEVCDETEIAELKVKVGDFEMHIKRNIGATTVPLSNISPTTPPPIPSKPMDESAPGTLPPSPPKSSPEKKNPFIDSFREKSPRLAALEASGTTTYVLVPSPTVGFFRRGRTVKGKRQPPICKEGDLVTEGQIIGYLDQFGTGLPVKTDVAGVVLKLVVDDGEPVGYGDPLIAVLPSFHDIK
ncbi:acetyl-CoA carboxylase biotin carboxyl carrier protein [Vigna unguiculata]|uniref:Acetyl-CoA carboxylase biotin carboxyl carrier protein n=2 Tax=Vigna unguiculata TaxID=3917 RepID=A0A4D6MBA2_VIGUN|nr:acetyl-CoA carboxylase biotin carboxyl carrier protein [Vigna unguiculata]